MSGSSLNGFSTGRRLYRPKSGIWSKSHAIKIKSQG